MAGEREKSELPSGWCWATVGELAGRSGFCRDGDWVESKDQDSNGAVRLIQLADVGVGVFNDRSKRYMTDAKAAQLGCTFLEVGDVLVSRMADPIGRACRFPELPQRCVTVVDVAILRVDDSLAERAYVMHWFNAPTTTAIVDSVASGTTRKRISRSVLESLEFPLPPLAEQRRIVAKLEELLGRIRRARAALDAVPAMVERYKKSVLGAAFERCSLDAVLSEMLTDGPKNGLSVVESSTPGGVISLKLSATTTGRFVFNDQTTKRLDLDLPESSDLWLRAGDILVQRANSIEYVGVAALVNQLPERSIYPDLMMRLRVSSDCDPAFVVHQLSSPRCRRWLRDRATGTAGNMPKINGQTLRALPVTFPPLDEQRAIVARIDAAFARARALLTAAETARTQLDALERSVLAKAFRGELVPQDPSDEPASALLERVRAACAERAAPKRAKKAKRASA